MMARRVSQHTMVQDVTHAPRLALGARAWSQTALFVQTACTRLRLPSVPEAWATAKLLRQVHDVRHTRRMTVRHIPAFLSRALTGHSALGSPDLCGRPSVRALHACNCATHICNKPGPDFTGVNLRCR